MEMNWNSASEQKLHCQFCAKSSFVIEDSPSSGQAQGPEQGQGKATDDVVETLIVSVWAPAGVEDAAAAVLAVQQAMSNNVM